MDLCDFVYVLLVERVERAALAERQIMATMKAGGHYQVGDIPTVEEFRDRFDAALIAETPPGKPVDPEQLQLRRALGVA